MASEAGATEPPSDNSPYKATKVFDVPLDEGKFGALHMSHAPGLQSKLTNWHRNLNEDLDRLQSVYGTTVVVSMLPKAEADLIAVEHEARAVTERGMRFVGFPIRNGETPSDEDAFDAFIARLVDGIRRGDRVLVHCRAGFGRAGVVAACALLAVGKFPTADEAITFLRAKRKAKHTQVVETEEQEAFVRDFARRTLM
eukprot:Amastigsp_a508661_17.p3 type:complete len:198 gc:universal Amastigsp_a508661_17:63-656(+)